jgi:hypothetical protein
MVPKKVEIPKGNLIIGMVNGFLIEVVFILLILLMVKIF